MIFDLHVYMYTSLMVNKFWFAGNFSFKFSESETERFTYLYDISLKLIHYEQNLQYFTIFASLKNSLRGQMEIITMLY